MKAKQSGSSVKPSSSSGRSISRHAYNLAKSTLPGNGDPMGGTPPHPSSSTTSPKATHDDKSSGGGQLNTTNPFSSSFTNANYSTVRFTGDNSTADFDLQRQQIINKQMEDEIMGDHRSSRTNQKSNAMEKNLYQMIDVLSTRLKNLNEIAKIRMKLCEDDINEESQNTSKQAPRIGDDTDEVIPRSLRDSKYGTMSGGGGNTMTMNNAGSTSAGGGGGSGGPFNHLKDNLVSSDAIYIDPIHLVLRTKVPTETAKKLEINLEQSFGNLNLREMKNKKTKAMNQTDKSKRTEQLKNDKKRENRQRIEKKLQMVMESFVTRSVMDSDLVFELPDNLTEEPDWPVSVKWCRDDPRSLRHENSEGEFNPDLLLRYSIERINLPSGRGVFVWILKQAVVQRYFVALFWFIKVKFFENETEDREAFLLRLLAIEYREIVELMANRTHAEHEKDFVYKYLPFLLTNAVYFGFYYVFPGSRHIYTKGFKKTIYMQVIQVMHGIQVCPITVKVSWAKLFPEDIHDDNEDNEDGGELFPVQIAFKVPRIRQAIVENIDIITTRSTSPMSELPGLESKDDEFGGGNTPIGGSLPRSNRAKGGILIEEDRPSSATTPKRRMSSASASFKPGKDIDNSIGQMKRKSRSAPFLKPIEGGDKSVTAADNQSQSVAQSQSMAAKSQTVSQVNTSTTLGSLKGPMDMRADEVLDDKRLHDPFLRTYLHPPPHKPTRLRGLMKRQSLVERQNAEEVSPAMAFFLASRNDAQGLLDHHFGQTLRRTIPVQWCVAGGSDTHRRKPIHHELHNDISNKLKQSEATYHNITSEFHHKKIATVRELEKSLTKVLSSGSTNISRMSLDLIRRQRATRGNSSPSDAPATFDEQIDMAEMAQLAQYDDGEIDRFLAEL